MSDGYRFVSLPDLVQRAPREYATHDRRVAGAFSGTIELTFRTEQPVHVGSGFKALRGEDIVRRGATVRDEPGVPGSSLKGVLRSRYEAITKSCALQAPSGGKVRSQSHPDVRQASFTAEVRQLDVFRSCDAGGMCPACALFGRMSQRSRISVTDFAADGSFVLASLPEQFGPNAHHLGEYRIEDDRGQRRFVVRSLKGRKFGCEQGPIAPNVRWQTVEAIPTGVLLRGSLRVLNLRPEELGALLAVLGKEPASALKIGAGKGQGFGRIRLHGLAFQLRDHARAAATPQEAAWTLAFDGCNDRWAQGENELVRIHQGDC